MLWSLSTPRNSILVWIKTKTTAARDLGLECVLDLPAGLVQKIITGIFRARSSGVIR